MLGPQTCETCAVRHRALCNALSSDEIKRMNGIAFRRHYPAGALILGDSEEPEFFANIVNGVVKLSKMMPDGRQQIVGLQFASDLIGRPFAARNPFFAEAASEVELCCFRKRQFEDLVRQIPDLEHRMLQHTLDELDAARAWMVLLGRKSAEERIASFIAMVVDRAEKGAGCAASVGPKSRVSIELPLTRAEIADYLGLTIETVSRQFTRLKSSGVIDVVKGRHLEITDTAALRDAAGDLSEMAVGLD